MKINVNERSDWNVHTTLSSFELVMLNGRPISTGPIEKLKNRQPEFSFF